ncbi:MAG: beta-galactosidase [Treponema sp.]|nr:beta-galactosidase [Treponema sp.]
MIRLPPLLAALLFFSCASMPEGLLPRDIPADVAGMVHAGRTKSPEEYALLDDLGVTWMLTTFYWSGIEPADDQWDFASYDAYVDAAKAAGKKVLGVLGYDVPWIHADGKSRYYVPPDKRPYFLDYVRTTAAHFRGRVDAWCVWNEPNFSFWSGPEREFFPLAREASQAVREADPGVILLGGAFNRGVFGLPKRFIRGLFESGAMEQADAAAFHPYELNPQRAAKLYDEFRRTADAYGFGGRIWITEMGYPTGGWYPTAVSEKRFPASVIKTFVLLAVRGPRTIFWYQLFDPEKREWGNSEDFFGLVRSAGDYRSKAAEAYKLCARYLAGTRYDPAKPLRNGLPRSLHSFYFEGDETHVLVLWNEGLFPQTARISLPGTGHTRRDPVSGAAVPIRPETTLKVGAKPVFITWQGGGEARISR